MAGSSDILALDAQGRVTVIEVKRDVDRSQSRPTLEYAGWGPETNLDELAGLYKPGPEHFFKDWQDFTGTSSPLLLNSAPKLMLVARSFDARTAAALDYLRTAGVPWRQIRVVFYADEAGNRIIDVDNGDGEVASPSKSTAFTSHSAGTTQAPSAATAVKLIDLLEAGLIQAGENITWRRPQVGELHHATIDASGTVVLADGRTFNSLSTAADTLTGGSHNGWEVWSVPRLGDSKIGVFRSKLAASL